MVTWEFLRGFFPLYETQDWHTYFLSGRYTDATLGAESSVFASGTTSDWNLSFVWQSSVAIFGIKMKFISQLSVKVKLQKTASFFLYVGRGALLYVPHETVVLGLHTLCRYELRSIPAWREAFNSWLVVDYLNCG